MYCLTVTLHDQDSLLQSKQLYLNDLDIAKGLFESVKLPEYSQDDDIPEGKIVTPLRPNKVHSSKGIVTPKLPIEIDREEAARSKEDPLEKLPNEPEE